MTLLLILLFVCLPTFKKRMVHMIEAPWGTHVGLSADLCVGMLEKEKEGEQVRGGREDFIP